jgi:type I restriction enzyme M protein
MRKSLGEKRKAISTEQIAEITRLYGDFADGERVKILPNEAFGFLRITVERPRRLRWSISDETLAAVSVAKGVAKLSETSRTSLVGSLRAHLGLSEVDRGTAAKVVDPAIHQIALTTPQTKAVWDALSVRDAEAPAVLDKKGHPEPDPELRDGENVPLPAISVVFEADPTERLCSIEYRTAVDDYMAAEVLPYVEDAWVDHDKTKIGYEIPLTRHFYKYVPPRPLAEIDAELKALEAEIQELLREVTE